MVRKKRKPKTTICQTTKNNLNLNIFKYILLYKISFNLYI